MSMRERAVTQERDAVTEEWKRDATPRVRAAINAAPMLRSGTVYDCGPLTPRRR
jgi:hypothetical protein